MSNNTTLYKLLKKTAVIIPRIQRDYAQGRKENAFIRKTFLLEIKNHLEKCEGITLDFVYGNKEHDSFRPLDGQQRLTTLWLIHWYFSFKAGRLSEDCSWLEKFSYETRTSSKEFCKSICENMARIDDSRLISNIADFIKAQTWFYSAWIQDPTISSMLRTISGESDSQRDDCIEGLFALSNYSDIRDKLISKDLVSFEIMEIGSDELPISDDLYIKINARGKGLTDFENFKADFIAWMQNENNPDHDKIIKENVNQQSYQAQIDNAWTDVFWNASKANLKGEFKGNFDEIFFSFINRYILNEICLRELDMSSTEFAPNKEESSHRKPKEAFNKLLGIGLNGVLPNDSDVSYCGFDIYEKYLDYQTIKNIDVILSSLRNNPSIVEIIQRELNIKDPDDETELLATENNRFGYSFIPRYKIIDSCARLAPTRQKERVYFLAICLFICSIEDHNTFDEESFRSWIRILKNLTENAAIDNLSSMVACMRLIANLAREMSKDKWGCECLKSYSGEIGNSQLGLQLKEEIEKAKAISNNPTWKEKIIDAEQFAFFNGSIRFLFQDDEGNIDWKDFDVKFNAAKCYFAQSSAENVVKIDTIVAFLKLFKDFDETKDLYLYTSIGYHPRQKCWKKDILCSENPSMISKVHKLLMNEKAPSHDTEYQYFLNSGLISIIVGKNENYKYRYHWYHYWAVHKDYSQNDGIYVSMEHKEKCQNIKNLVEEDKIILLDLEYNAYHFGFYWGTHLSFKYGSKAYNWFVEYSNGAQEDRIYVIDDNENLHNYVIWEKDSDLLQTIEVCDC